MPRFPFFKQLDSADCGPTCLKMIAKFYGQNYNLEYLREKMYVSRRGVSLLGLSEAAEAIGLHTKGVRLSWAHLRDEAPLPCIVHWNRKHFVVVIDIPKQRSWRRLFSARVAETVLVADPSLGMIKYTIAEFLKSWNTAVDGALPKGVALLLEPTPKFYSEPKGGNDSKISLWYLAGYIRPYSRLFLQLILGLTTGTLLSLIFPFLAQAIVDYGINNRDVGFIFTILIAQLTLSGAQTVNSLLQSWISLHITSRVSISLIAGYLAKLMKLPIAYFDSKTIGDFVQRINDHNRIQSFITGSLITLIFSLVTLLGYSIIMWSYQPLLLAIFYVGSLLYLLWIFIFLKLRKEIDQKRFQQASMNQSNLVQLITGMQEIRLSGCETQKRWEWERIQAKLFKISIRGLALNQKQIIGSSFIDQSKNIVISFLSAKAVVDGDISLGAMVAIQYMIGQLNVPIHQFLGFIQSGQDASISLERLGEIYNKEDEENADEIKIQDIPGGSDIVVKNLSFQYEGAHSQKVLSNLNFTIPNNRVTAIVGASGSGKTTFLKILAGIYSPTDGDVLLNNTSIGKYSLREWRKHCGVVMQEGIIFNDSIARNVGIIDEFPSTSRIEHAVSVAKIKDFIESLPQDYNTVVGSNGHGLSSGQKQRLFIARAVYKEARFLFFDEATNALDAKNERAIIEGFEDFFKDKTAVIIAHRLSTIRKAHQIVVFDKGSVVEVGGHEELLLKKGAYFNLVENQL